MQLEAYIELDPRRPTIDNARLKLSGVPVWAVVDYYLSAANHDRGRVAHDFEISLDEVAAALAYYDAYAAQIDVRIALNRVPASKQHSAASS